ncbi:MAG: SWIM zinc finger family protein [Gammaproteobacteria bacterium]|nr:SWIM zinc finger family protein [Gammaproteobacteria bacterium]
MKPAQINIRNCSCQRFTFTLYFGINFIVCRHVVVNFERQRNAL